MSLQFWQIALPRLSKAIGSSVSGEDVYEIEMHAAKHDFHPAAAKIPVWCYRDKNPGAVLHDQTYLGPIIEATVGTPVRVTWINNLPTDKKFPYTGFYAQTPENLETVSIQALNRGHVLACCPQYRL